MKVNTIIGEIISPVVLITILGFFGAFKSYGQKDSPQQSTATPTPEIVKDTRDLSKYGSVDYNAPQIENSTEWEKRRQISQRYDNQDWVVKSVHPVTGGIGKITEDPPPPLFPIEESALIVVGEVETANAFLSNDKGGVYTEFTIRVDDVLKNNSKRNPKKVTADREGGVVVYPNGQRVLYQSSELGLPLIGSKYLFFLTKDELSPNYEILTSYDLNSSVVRQMEMGRPFDEFKDFSKTDLIETVRTKIARSTNKASANR